MTRNEQIKEAANQYAEHFPRAKNASFVSFTAGVEWSEQNQGSVDWQQVRIQADIAAMQGILANEKISQDVDKTFSSAEQVYKAQAMIAVSQADALVKELKGE